MGQAVNKIIASMAPTQHTQGLTGGSQSNLGGSVLFQSQISKLREEQGEIRPLQDLFKVMGQAVNKIIASQGPIQHIQGPTGALRATCEGPFCFKVRYPVLEQTRDLCLGCVV